MRRVFFWILLIALVSIPLGLYLSARDDTALRGPDGVALIEVSGTIGELAPSVWEGTAVAHPREIGRQLRLARETPRVRAVVLRINSPGGSPAASQEIHREVARVREAGKPVVVSMGDGATSGAYYVAVAADQIVANPSTLTGSISVRSQVYNVEELLENWGVRVEELTTGTFKSVGSPFRSMDDAERELLQAVIDDMHLQFVDDVAEGRGLSTEEVHPVADGRVLTGTQALELGLVDRLGSLEDTIELAGELAGLEERPPVIDFRPPPTLLERWLGMAAWNRGALGVDSERLFEERLLWQVIFGAEWGFTIHW